MLERSCSPLLNENKLLYVNYEPKTIKFYAFLVLFLVRIAQITGQITQNQVVFS